MFNIIGVDPGTNHCGYAIISIDNNLNITNIVTDTIDIHSDLTLMEKLNYLYNSYSNIFEYYKPYWLSIEAGFINRFRPAAYGPIAKAIWSIEKAFIDYIKLYNISEYPPKYVKKIITKGTADKNDILLAISSNSDLNKYLTGYESEHAIDALAICYVRYLEIKNEPLSLISM